jgi:hypothetical protein
MNYFNTHKESLVIILSGLKKRIFIFLLMFIVVTSSTLIAQNKKANGKNATIVKFGNKSSSFLGTFVKESRKNVWVQKGKRGIVRFKFRETHRDAWSVYLVDNSRGVYISLDLHAKKVMYSDKKNKKKILLYTIVGSSGGLNGFTVSYVNVYDGYGNSQGSFLQEKGLNWVHKNRRVTDGYKELGRDEWSVRLVSKKSENTKLRLDLHTGKVIYRYKKNPPRTIFYIK